MHIMYKTANQLMHCLIHCVRYSAIACRLNILLRFFRNRFIIFSSSFVYLASSVRLLVWLCFSRFFFLERLADAFCLELHYGKHRSKLTTTFLNILGLLLARTCHRIALDDA
uniref:(northern house mosquito) hypothetical protein n=1 Tax=Culex pipiens TaxID=7175 RepID=A0A8D8AIE2_CULPI